MLHKQEQHMRAYTYIGINAARRVDRGMRRERRQKPIDGAAHVGGAKDQTAWGPGGETWFLFSHF